MERYFLIHNDYISHLGYIQLYTDAAPSIGFSGYHGGCWVASQWPPEFSSLNLQSSAVSTVLCNISHSHSSHPLGVKMVQINTHLLGLCSSSRNYNKVDHVRQLSCNSCAGSLNLRSTTLLPLSNSHTWTP